MKIPAPVFIGEGAPPVQGLQGDSEGGRRPQAEARAVWPISRYDE